MINSTEILLPAVILYGKNERNQTVMCIASSSLAIFQFLNILSTNVFIAFIHLSDPTSHPLPPALTHSCRIIRCVCGIRVIYSIRDLFDVYVYKMLLKLTNCVTFDQISRSSCALFNTSLHRQCIREGVGKCGCEL